jgi:hypothetical protein
MTSTAVALDPEPFAGKLWLCWIAAALFNESLSTLAWAWYVSAPEDNVGDAFGNGLLFLCFKALIVPVAATTQWWVLRRALPRLPWAWWLAVAVVAAVTTLLILSESGSPTTNGIISRIWLSFAWGVPFVTFASGVFLVVSATAQAILLALFALSWAAERWPIAFIICSMLAAIVTAPLYVAAEHASLLERWLLRVSDPQAMLAVQASLRLAAAAVDGAFTGCGLWLLCRPPARISATRSFLFGAKPAKSVYPRELR